jgi:hypothetical protein
VCWHESQRVGLLEAHRRDAAYSRPQCILKTELCLHVVTVNIDQEYLNRTLVVTWAVTPCTPVDGYQCFRGTSCVVLHPEDGYSSFPKNVGDHLQDPHVKIEATFFPKVGNTIPRG